uniref:Stabilin 1 n=1 Tax=Ictidomys tridecemlineatus TaxID=43179 RepID=A0A287DEP4_ICTTR
APGAVLVGRVIIWDIMAFNGIIHALASPLLAPPQPAEDDAGDDFSPWQEVNSPTLVSVPNPVFGNHDAFCEPFDDSLLEDDFPDTQRILAVK